jgi:hypothetical protein
MPNPSPKDLIDLGFEQPNTSETGKIILKLRLKNIRF